MTSCTCAPVARITPVPRLPVDASDQFEDGRVGHPAALAHGLQAVADPVLAHPVHQRRHEAGAGRTERVAQGDGAATGVRQGRVGTGVRVPGAQHRREGLVDLERADVGELEAGPLERPLGRRDGAGEHDHRVDAGHRDGVDPGQRGQPELGRARRRHDQQGGRAVGDLRGVAGGDDAVLLEGGLEPGERLDRRAGPDALVLAHRTAGRVHGDDLLVEEARGLGRGGPRVRRGGDLVEVLAGQAPALRDHLGADALVHQAVVVAGVHARREGSVAADHVREHRHA